MTVLARAKVNLTLHVGAAISDGRWTGYHPVESLVVFADYGDSLRFEPAKQTSLHFSGPYGSVLSDTSDNLIRRALEASYAMPQCVEIEKRIPVAAGLGGGSANAAAILRHFDPRGDVDAVSLGADVPVCRLECTAMMEGIGERVTTLPSLGKLASVLVNPGVPISTGKIFNAFDSKHQAANPAQTIRNGSLLERALSGKNDLQPFAIEQAPIISDVLVAIDQQPGCQLARMSGSGATCFGLFETLEQAEAAQSALSDQGWWAIATMLGDAS